MFENLFFLFLVLQSLIRGYPRPPSASFYPQDIALSGRSGVINEVFWIKTSNKLGSWDPPSNQT